MIFAKENKQLLKDENGAVAIITAVVLVFVLLGIAALAVDIGRQSSAKNELQNAVDAAALAGAVELAKDGYAEVETQAVEAAERNIVDNIPPTPSSVDIGYWSESEFYTDNDTLNAVRVTVEDHEIGSFFAPLFGMSQSVSATATAVVGPAGAVERLIPIYITEDVAEEFDEEMIYKKFGSDDPAGNWGLTSFFETGVADHGEWFEDGYPELVSTGDDINIQTGTGGVQPYRSEVIALEDETVIVPVVEELDEEGHQQSKVVGFRAVEVISVDVSGAGSEIVVSYVEEIVPGELDFGAGDFGVRTIALVE